MSEFINTADVIGDDEMCDQIIQRTVTEYKENRVTKVGPHAFTGCEALSKLIVPCATLTGGGQCFECTALKIADIFSTGHDVWDTFFRCTSLVALVIRSNTVCAMTGPNFIGNTPIVTGTGYIYVPRALLSDDDETKDYRRATNWSTYAAQFRALEDYTVDGTTTGELDETKI